jgi:hypothetical protein
LSLKPFVNLGDFSGLWLALVPQVLVTSCILAAVASAADARRWAWLLPMALFATPAPWHASQIMPDAYAGGVVLIGWICAHRRAAAPGSPLLWFAASLLCLMHSTYPALLVASVAASLLVQRSAGLEVRFILQRVGALMVALAVTVGVQMSVNAALIHKATYSPRSSMFLFARLNADGMVTPYLAKACPESPEIRDICALAPSLPRDDQVLLWRMDSPFRRTVWQQRFNQPGIDWDRQLGIVSRGAIANAPVQFMILSARATFRQLFAFQVLDDQCPEICLASPGTIQNAFERERPRLRDRVNSAPQMRGLLPPRFFEGLSTVASYAGLLGLVVTLIMAWRRRDHLAASLILSVTAGLLANASVTASLSGVFDRYQSRVVWLAPIACLLVALRWRAELARPLNNVSNPG